VHTQASCEACANLIGTCFEGFVIG